MNPLRWLARLFRWGRCRYVSPPGSWRSAASIRAIAAAPEFQPWNPSPDDPLIDELGDDERERS